LTGSQIDALGRRIRDNQSISEVDLGLFEKLLGEYAEALDQVNAGLQELGLNGHPRLKSTDVTREKLQRENVSLRGIHDLAGTRVVKRMTLDEQDQIVAQICAGCPGARQPPIDRRAEPNNGYRAVHVVCKVDGRWVEIQIRTFYQDTWAQLMEKMGDWYGRQIRYGEPPNRPDEILNHDTGMTTRGLIELMVRMSGHIAVLEESENTATPDDDHPVRQFIYDMRERMNMPEIP
jgi:ppGpp synthetase/RelA/SpoT-type nucleotidyltranferase